MVKRYPDLERGESASETGRTHIPPRLFKEAVHLNRMKDQIIAILNDSNPFNKKSKAEELKTLLDKYVPGVEAMRTRLKKYDKTYKELTEENAELRRLAKKAEAAQARTAEELQAFREKTSLDRYLLQSYLADELEAHRTAKQVRKQRRRAALENAFRRRVESKLEILANIAQALEKTRAALDDGIDEPGEQELAKHREELDALIAAVRQREAQVRTRSIQRYETALRVLRANPSAKAKAELGEAFDSLRKLLEK